MALSRLLLLTCALASAVSAEADIYISTNGNDANVGSEDQPLRTFKAAQEAVRKVNADMESDIKVLVGPGTYRLEEPLVFTSDDSGSNGHRVIWEANDSDDGATISGGIPVQDWKLHDGDKSIYTASVKGASPSRHLYVNNKHAQRAREELDRSWLNHTANGYTIVDGRADIILGLSGLDQADIVGINSFTHRISPIAGANDDNDGLLMKQPAFDNNAIGYDSMTDPFKDWGFYIENSIDLLDEENEYYLDTKEELLYYKPASNQSIDQLDVVLAQLEELLILKGSYDEPVHHLTFQGFNYMHTTWNYPSTGVGYADQQTGGFVGLNRTYPENFEASRPFWWQIPGSIQVSASHDITFQNGSVVAVMNGFGIGNDPNAHSSGLGLGTSGIEISGMNFFEVGSNAITLGGIQQDAHHPSDPRMEVKDTLITENIFRRIGATISSCVPIFASYTTNTKITHNDISDVPYSGLAWGYGWGANDAGGSEEYVKRGLYEYQPIFETPTTMSGGLIAKNLIHNYGLNHNDLGGIYTLSKSPGTVIEENWIIFHIPDEMSAIYHDEGSRDYINRNSVVEAAAENWLWRNARPGYTTGNLTISGYAVNQPPNNGENEWGDTVSGVTQWSTYQDLTPEQKSWVYNAGIPPSQRSSRPVSKDQQPL